MDTNHLDNYGDTKSQSEKNEAINKAQDKASELADAAQQQVKEVSNQAKIEAKSNLQSQKNKAARELHNVAEALRQTSSNLEMQDQSMVAQYSNQVAEGVEKASTYLEEHDFEDLIYEAEDFARRQPELFIGGAFTLGLLAARFLKSSASSTSSYADYDANLPARTRATAVSPASSDRLYASPPFSGHSPVDPEFN